MKQEDKQLLLVDLCARLPYGVKVQIKATNCIDGVNTLNLIDLNSFIEDCPRDEDWYDVVTSIKPYLRPLSSMTEEEKKEFIEYAGYEIEESVNGRHYEYYLKDFCCTPDNPSVNADGIDWLNKKMFDYRGLIEKSLAIKVTEDNNPYKIKL